MFSWTGHRKGRALIVAHRGASGAAPENTIAAFRRAVLDGADAFELDVRLTADGSVVVIHDRTLFRTTGAGGRVSSATAGEIRRLSAGRWFAGEFARERIPFLEEVLDLAAGGTGVNIELKFDSLLADPAPLVRRVCDIVCALPRHENILISSFHHGALALQRSLAPAIATGILVYPPGVPTSSAVPTALRMGASWVIYSGGNIRKSFVERADANGLRTMEYTVNGRIRLRRAVRFGVDAVITNMPASIRRLLAG